MFMKIKLNLALEDDRYFTKDFMVFFVCEVCDVITRTDDSVNNRYFRLHK